MFSLAPVGVFSSVLGGRVCQACRSLCIDRGTSTDIRCAMIVSTAASSSVAALMFSGSSVATRAPIDRGARSYGVGTVQPPAVRSPVIHASPNPIKPSAPSLAKNASGRTMSSRGPPVPHRRPSGKDNVIGSEENAALASRRAMAV